MVDLPFFHPSSVGDLVNAALDLALIFKCDPYRFLDLQEDELAELYRVTSERLREMRSEE